MCLEYLYNKEIAKLKTIKLQLPDAAKEYLGAFLV